RHGEKRVAQAERPLRVEVETLSLELLLPALADVSYDAEHLRRIPGRDRKDLTGPLAPAHRPAGSGDSKFDAERRALRGRATRGDDQLPVVRVDRREKLLLGALGRMRRDSEEFVKSFGQAQGSGREVPAPRAHPCRRQSEREPPSSFDDLPPEARS